MADLSSYINIAANTVTTANLSATGNVVSNSEVSTAGNVTGNYIIGDGSQLTGITVSGNAPVSTTGNVSAGNLTTTGTVSANNIGNIAALNLNGNASTVLYGNGVFAAVAGGSTYGNSNVNTLLAAWGSNTVSTTGNITAGYLFGNGSQLTGLPATYGNANVTTLLGAFGSNTVSTTGTVYAGNTSTSGNATIGTALVIVGATNTLQTTNGSAVQFANRVNFNAAGSSIVASGNISGSNILGSVLSASGNIIGGNLLTAGQISATGNITTAGAFVGNGAALTNINYSSVGNIVGPQANVTLVAGSYLYVFDNTGNVTLPTNGDLVFSANTSLTSQSGSNGNITVNPDGTGQLVVTSITPATFGNTLSVTGTVTSLGNTNGTAFAVVGNGAASNVALGFFPTGNTPAEMAIRDYSTANSTVYFDTTIGSANTGGSFRFRSSNAYTTLATINTYGVVQPTKPGFRVYGNGVTTGLNITTNGNGVLNGNNWATDYNQGSYLNSTTGVFTAPVAGLYQVNLVARVANNTAGASQAVVVKNATTTAVNQIMWEVAANCTTNHFGVGTISKLAVGDTLTLKVTQGNVTFDVNDNWSVAFLG